MSVSLSSPDSSVPLPEDRDLQCFLPLEKSLSRLRFASHDWNSDPPALNRLRAARLVAFGDWLADQADYRLITRKTSSAGVEGLLVFEAVGGQQVNNQLLSTSCFKCRPLI